MMDIKELKKYTRHLRAFTAQEVDCLELMTDDELDLYEHELMFDSGNLSEWDHVRALITLKSKTNNSH